MRSNSRGLLQNRVILMVKSYPAAKLFANVLQIAQKKKAN